MGADATDEITFVVLDGQINVIRVDHQRKRQNAWSLSRGRWVEVNVADALFKGRIVSRDSMGEFPELPEWS